MPIFNVAAVQDVQIKTENGESKLVPKPEFTSLGLDEISDWIVQQVKGKRRSIFGMFSLGTVIGGTIGFLVGGPVGAAIGTAVGGGAGAFTGKEN